MLKTIMRVPFETNKAAARNATDKQMVIFLKFKLILFECSVLLMLMSVLQQGNDLLPDALLTLKRQ